MITYLFVFSLSLASAHCEYFSTGEHDFTELSGQWVYLNKWAFNKKGAVEVVCKFTKPSDVTQVVKLALYQYKDVASWGSLVRDVNSCSDRLEAASYSWDLVVEDDRETESERECYNYYGDVVCELQKDINGNSKPWVFVAVVFCDGDLADIGLKWRMHATNGGSEKEVPVNDMGLYQAFLALTILAALFLLFWLVYYKEIQLNPRVALPFKIALFVSVIGYALITGFYGRLQNTGYRNDSLFNAGILFLLLGFVLIIQSSLSAVWSGSIMTVHLPRWKTVLTYLAPLSCVIAMGTIFTLQYLAVDQSDVYPFEQRADRYLVWVTCGCTFLIWVLFTVPVVMSLSSKRDKIGYLRVLYLLISLYLLGLGGSPLIANFNMKIEHRKLFVLCCFGASHLLTSLFLFLCIKDNHTWGSVVHFWRVLVVRYLCCGGCKGGGEGAADKKSTSHRRGGACYSVCPCCAPCCPCLPCCSGPSHNGGLYNSETDLRNVLVKSKALTEKDGFDLKILDVEEEEAPRSRTPNTIIQSEPIVIGNPSPEDTSSRSRLDGGPRHPPGRNLITEAMEGFSDEEQEHPVKTQANFKVLPWLYHNKPNEELTAKRKFSNLVIQNVIKQHGYTNHWKSGSSKAFATADNKPIVLYKRPDSDQMFSASQSSLDGLSGAGGTRGGGKPLTLLPYNKSPAPSSRTPTKQMSVPGYSTGTSHVASSSGGLASRSVVLSQRDNNVSDEEEEDEVRFNAADYNNSKLRDNKAKTVTMMYRRETLKTNLNNIPTSLLLQRVPDGTVPDDPQQVISRTKVVRMSKPKPEPAPTRRKSLWGVLANKYSGKTIEGLSGEEMADKAVKVWRSNVNRTRRP